jgi:hypothetical protein
MDAIQDNNLELGVARIQYFLNISLITPESAGMNQAVNREARLGVSLWRATLRSHSVRVPFVSAPS